MEELYVLLMLLTANGSPIVARLLLRNRYAWPLDHGRMAADGRRLLGPSKTYRGLIAAVLATTLVAVIIGYPWHTGPVIGSLAMLGDACSSYLKRRFGLPSGTMAAGLDHVPESLLPLLACKPLLGLSWGQVVLLSVAFILSHLLLSRLLYRLGIRRHPY